MAVDALETPVPVFLPPELLEVSLPGKIPFLFHAARICEKKIVVNIRENTMVLYCSTVNNFDFTKKNQENFAYMSR